MTMANAKFQLSSGKNPKKYLLKVYSSSTSLNTSQTRGTKRKRARKMLKQSKILRTILQYLHVSDIVTKIVSLSKSTRTQQFRFNVDYALKQSVMKGLTEEERIQCWLYKTKIHKILKYNEPHFYSQLCRHSSKLKYDGEIKKDL